MSKEEENRSRKYEVEPILRLAESLKDDNESYTWLKENDYKELAAFRDVILYANESAKDWLYDHNFNILSAFLSAIANSDSAFDYMMKSDYKEWGAVFSILQGDEAALDWLLKHDLKHYGYLARVIYVIKESQATDSWFSYVTASQGRTGGGLSSGGSGGGFSGGGGNFGGGGASGSW